MKVLKHIIFLFFTFVYLANTYSAEHDGARQAENILPPIKISGTPERLVFFETFDRSDIAATLDNWTKLGSGYLRFVRENTIEGNALVIGGNVDSRTLVKSIPINLKPNKQYRLAYYIKTKFSNCDGDVIISSGDKAISGPVYKTENRPGWIYCETLFRTSDKTVVNINLISNGRGEIEFDQIMLFEAEKLNNTPHPATDEFFQAQNMASKRQNS